MRKVILIFLMLLLFSNLSFADTSEVKIGLSHGDSSIEEVTLISENGFTFGIDNSGYFVDLASFITNSLSIQRDTVARIEMEHLFTSGTETSQMVAFINGLGYNAYSGYNDGFKVYIERSSDINHLNNVISGLMPQLPDYTFTIKESDPSSVIVMSGTAPLFYYNSNEFDFVFKDLNKGLLTYKGKSYRNAIGVKRNINSNFTVINYLSMKEYLYGVLPKEMSGDWPLEALKAQAVAARNYTITTMGKHSEFGYDLCNTTDCQVYGGADVEKPRSNQAVDETAGVILKYQDETVSAFYHSNSGGYTANIEDVWTFAKPYLVSVSDPYSINQPQYSWSLTYTPSEMNALINNGGYNVGTLTDLSIIEQRATGRVVKIKATGTKGTHTFEKEQFRAFLGYSTLRSMLFDLVKSSNASVFNGNVETTVDTSNVYVLSASGMNTTNGKTVYAYDGKIKKDYQTSSDGYTFVGNGYGHGIGMSQWGAKAMAEQGLTYESILTHYYKDTHLEVMN